jgi:acyl-homoserine lactone acylase PvdQ
VSQALFCAMVCQRLESLRRDSRAIVLSGLVPAVVLVAAGCIRPPVATSVGGRHAIERSARELSQEVVIRRTTYGVPHIDAQNFAALGYAEAFVQSEDCGARVALSVLRVRGEWRVGSDTTASPRTSPAGRRTIAR